MSQRDEISWCHFCPKENFSVKVNANYGKFLSVFFAIL